MNIYRRLILTSSTLLFFACASVQTQNNIGTSVEATQKKYEQNKEKFGVVLLDARWGRQWKCGKYENAQLISFSFDKPSPIARPIDDSADITVGTTSLLAVSPKFESYALVVPPGEYVLSNFKIKIAQSVSTVGYLIANRSHLIKEGRPLGGSFTVEAGEVVYIGNFTIDCNDPEPTLWRYYTIGQDGFKKGLSDYKNKYPFLDLSSVKYRLFKTETIGKPYELK